MERTIHALAKGSLNHTALSATVHCLTGCAIGEVLGMVLGAAFRWDNVTTIAISVLLAFGFGYALTLLPLLRSGLRLDTALGLAFASDTLSIAVMEIIDNLAMVSIPGAMDAMPTTFLFWGAMGSSLVLAGIVAFPLNRWLIGRGRGHAAVHAHHAGQLTGSGHEPESHYISQHAHHSAREHGGQP